MKVQNKSKDKMNNKNENANESENKDRNRGKKRNKNKGQKIEQKKGGFKNQKEGQKKEKRIQKKESIHDYFFRKTYEKESNALDLFLFFLTKEELEFFDWKTLQTELTDIRKWVTPLRTGTLLSIMQDFQWIDQNRNIDFHRIEEAFSLSDHLTFEEKKETIKEAIRYIERVVPNLSIKVFQDLKEKNSKVGERTMRAYKSGFQMAKEEGLKEGLEKGRGEGLEKGMQKGIQEGRLEGSYEAFKQVIKNMLQEKQSVSVISKMTGLSEKEILEISKSFS